MYRNVVLFIEINLPSDNPPHPQNISKANIVFWPFVGQVGATLTFEFCNDSRFRVADLILPPPLRLNWNIKNKYNFNLKKYILQNKIILKKFLQQVVFQLTSLYQAVLEWFFYPDYTLGWNRIDPARHGSNPTVGCLDLQGYFHYKWHNRSPERKTNSPQILKIKIHKFLVLVI